MMAKLERAIARHGLAGMVGILIASEMVYILALVLRYPVLKYWKTPLLDMPKITDHQPAAAAEFTAAFIVLFVLWAGAVLLSRSFALRTDEHDRRQGAWVAVVLAGAVVLGITLMTVYPICAGDVFDYGVHGLLLAKYHVSPLVQVGSQYPNEPIMPYSGWRGFPSTYGPLWGWIEAAVVAVGGYTNVLGDLMGFKTVAMWGLLICTWLIGLIVKGRAPDRVLPSMVFFAWNPIVLFEAATNAHNDLVMLIGVLVGFLVWQRGQWPLAVIGMMLGMLVKVPPLPLLGLLGVAIVAQGRGWGKIARGAIVAGLVLAVLAVAYLTFPDGIASSKNLLQRVDLFTNSLPTVLKLSLQLVAPKNFAQAFVRNLTLLSLVFVAVWKAWQTYKTPERLLQYSFELILFLLLFATLWFQPWYILWLVALAAIYPGGIRGAGGAWALTGLFSWTVIGAYVVYGFAWFWDASFMNWGDSLGVQSVGFLATYTVPFVYLLQHWLHSRPRQNAPEPAGQVPA